MKTYSIESDEGLQEGYKLILEELAKLDEFLGEVLAGRDDGPSHSPEADSHQSSTDSPSRERPISRPLPPRRSE